MNITSFYTLFIKEINRFWKVKLQTLFAPVSNSLLYLIIFSSILKEQHSQISSNISTISFLIPGLIMMSMLQNAFANSASSLIQSKVTGNIIFILLPPINITSFFLAFVCAGAVRGFLVGIISFAIIFWFGTKDLFNIWWIIYFTIISCAFMSILGLLSGIICEKYDQMMLFQNFIIVPLTFLSGTFYSIKSLPTFWVKIIKFNPLFYMIDGFRYGFLGIGDINIILSAVICSIFCILLSIMVLIIIKTGYKLKN